MLKAFKDSKGALAEVVRVNGHTSEAIAKIYATDYEEFELKMMKKVDINIFD